MPGEPSVFLLSESRHHMSAAVKPLLCSRSTALYPSQPQACIVGCSYTT